MRVVSQLAEFSTSRRPREYKGYRALEVRATAAPAAYVALLWASPVEGFESDNGLEDGHGRRS